MADPPASDGSAVPAAGPRKSPWYADGLRFQCTMCGNCCSGPPGAVWFTPDEARAMAHDLGISHQQFSSAFARRINGHWSLKERASPHGLDCILLDRDSQPGKALCRVYKSRPAQCRSWPFWPEILASQESWQEFKSRTPCPGMDNGTHFSLTQIRIIRQASE